jgi:thiol-disulfide isomerase/thioredoxin
VIPRALTTRAVTTMAAGMLLAGCAGTEASQTGPGGGDSRYVAGDGRSQVIKAADRRQAPQVRGTTLDGKPFDLAGLKGKVVVVNFWASWCAPCRGEAPSLEQVYRENKGKGVEFAGVDIKDDAEPAKAFARTFKIGYPSIVDQSGQVTLAFRDVPPNAVPSTLVLDREGRIAARVIGATTYTKLSALLKQVTAG